MAVGTPNFELIDWRSLSKTEPIGRIHNQIQPANSHTSKLGTGPYLLVLVPQLLSRHDERPNVVLHWHRLGNGREVMRLGASAFTRRQHFHTLVVKAEVEQLLPGSCSNCLFTEEQPKLPSDVATTAACEAKIGKLELPARVAVAPELWAELFSKQKESDRVPNDQFHGQ